MANYLHKVADGVVNRFREDSDDEFQLDVLYRSVVVDIWFTRYAMLCVGVLLAWVLPPTYVWWSFIAFLPLILGECAGNWYMQAQVVRPRFSLKTTAMRIEYVFNIVMALVWLLGVARHPIFISPSFEVKGGMIGALVGFVAAALFLPKTMAHQNQRQRRKDARRLGEAEEV